MAELGRKDLRFKKPEKSVDYRLFTVLKMFLLLGFWPGAIWLWGGGRIEVFFLSLKISPLSSRVKTPVKIARHTHRPVHEQQSWRGSNWTYSPSLSELPLPRCVPMPSRISAVRQIFLDSIWSTSYHNSFFILIVFKAWFLKKKENNTLTFAQNVTFLICTQF